MGGKDAHNVLRVDNHENFDIIVPIWNGKLKFGAGAADTLTRAVIDVLLEYIASQIIKTNIPNGITNGTSTGTSGDKEKG